MSINLDLDITVITESDISLLVKIAREAGDKILQIYNDGFGIEYKDDNSPLTIADKMSNEIIVNALKSKYNDIPIVSEESEIPDYKIRKDWKRFWLVDPLDGTKDFVMKTGDFSICIALIENKKPILGLIHVPFHNITYYAVKGQGTFKINKDNEIEKLVKNFRESDSKLVITGSKTSPNRELEEFIDECKMKTDNVEFLPCGSAIKFGLIAEGKADIYPRLCESKEWDIAAGHIIVKESGSYLCIYQSEEELLYNKEDLSNPWLICKK